MSVDVSVFRHRCGLFAPVLSGILRRKARTSGRKVGGLKMRTRAAGVAVGLIVSLFFWNGLALAGDVESNPGPVTGGSAGGSGGGGGKGGDMRQTRLMSSGNGAISASTSPSFPKGKSEIQDLLARMNEFQLEQRKFNEESSKNFSSLEQKLDQFRRDNDENFASLNAELRSLKAEVNDLKYENDELRKQISMLNTKCNDLEARSKRSNIIVHGFKRAREEDCNVVLKTFLKDKLDIENVEFDRVHRIGVKDNAPIIAKCTFYKEKVSILKATGKLKGSNYFVGEDFPQSVRDIRRKLNIHFKKAREEGKKVFMVYDHLNINNEKFVLNGRGDGIEPAYK